MTRPTHCSQFIPSTSGRSRPRPSPRWRESCAMVDAWFLRCVQLSTHCRADSTGTSTTFLRLSSSLSGLIGRHSQTCSFTGDPTWHQLCYGLLPPNRSEQVPAAAWASSSQWNQNKPSDKPVSSVFHECLAGEV